MTARLMDEMCPPSPWFVVIAFSLCQVVGSTSFFKQLPRAAWRAPGFSLGFFFLA